MPHLKGTGPEGKGKSVGRQIGNCQPTNEEEMKSKLGKGMGLRRKSGGGNGLKKRIKSGIK